MALIFPPVGMKLGQPDWGFKHDPTADVEVVKLGDGYEFREPKGLNHISTAFQPVWSNLDPLVATAAYEDLLPDLKLRERLWIHPLTGATWKVIPEALSLEYDTWGNAILSITWRQGFNPG